MTEMALHAGLQILPRTQIDHMGNFHAMELLCHLRHRALEYNRFAHRVPKHDPVAVMNHGNGAFRSHNVLFVIFSPIHFDPPGD